jgi:hypothetical protein
VRLHAEDTARPSTEPTSAVTDDRAPHDAPDDDLQEPPPPAEVLRAAAFERLTVVCTDPGGGKGTAKVTRAATS